MQVYIGQTRSRRLVARLTELGFGEVTQRHEWPPRRLPWVLDNGAFGDWKAGRPFDATGFSEACASVEAAPVRPRWAVCPDRVAGGLESLAFSLDWLGSSGSAFSALSGRWYLAVQDGMDEGAVAEALSSFAGIFVGDSLPWKVATGAAWVRFAHRMNRPCHIGRVGTPKRVRWARRVGADSIDSCLPLWSEDNLRRFLTALEGRQLELL